MVGSEVFKAGMEVVRAGLELFMVRLDCHRSIFLPKGRDKRAEIGHVGGIGHEKVGDRASPEVAKASSKVARASLEESRAGPEVSRAGPEVSWAIFAKSELFLLFLFGIFGHFCFF